MTIDPDTKARLATAWAETNAETPVGLWPHAEIDTEASDRLPDGELAYVVGPKKLRMRGPQPHPDAPFLIFLGLSAAITAAVLGECPACHRTADIVGNDPEPRRCAFYLLDVSVRVTHHPDCVAADDRLKHYLLPPYGDAPPIEIDPKDAR